MKNYTFAPEQYKKQLISIFKELETPGTDIKKILKKYPSKDGFFSRNQLVSGYNYLVDNNLISVQSSLLEKVKMKPIRTMSGVTPVTVLTKPFPCPGKCIFCPNDIRMPKSYLADEPGAQRAEMNKFDPYLQTYNRLLAYKNIGHNLEKIELIVLGGTWSFYPTIYQIWFIKRCFDAMNDFGIKDNRSFIKTENIFLDAKDNTAKSYNENLAEIARLKPSVFLAKEETSTWKELEEAQKLNESSISKCVGLVLETRPDYINPKEIVKLRRLGATKLQIGIQSLDNNILDLNKRGHSAEMTAQAIKLIRQGGFKIHAHWMPNLFGATVQSDIEDYKKLWGKNYSPDELKIYPTSIIKNTELYEEYINGNYQPYTYNELLEVLKNSLPETPRYCRLTRIIRDIPSTDIVAGNKLTNFRQIVEDKILQEGKKCNCIRCREIKDREIIFDELELEVIQYDTSVSTEYFISYKTIDDDKIVSFLRLSIPDKNLSKKHFIDELKDSSIIREIHVYGKVVGIGKNEKGKSQHIGLGTKLIEKAINISIQNHFSKISVISAIGTREYYRKKGFHMGELYMCMELNK